MEGFFITLKMTYSPDYIADYANTIVKTLIEYSPKVISAFLIVFVGIWILLL